MRSPSVGSKQVELLKEEICSTKMNKESREILLALLDSVRSPGIKKIIAVTSTPSKEVRVRSLKLSDESDSEGVSIEIIRPLGTDMIQITSKLDLNALYNKFRAMPAAENYAVHICRAAPRRERLISQECLVL